MPLSLTLFINTRNRKDELRIALASVMAQDLSCEVMVLDDASTDGTPEMVRAEFPSVRLELSEQNLGVLGQRNRAAQLSKADILVCIDDDAVLPSPSILRDTLKDFDDPRIGVVAMPYIDTLYSPRCDQPQAPPEGLYTTSAYRGCAHALRRQLFVDLKGYDTRFGGFGEESHYCIRMLEAGYVVRLGRSAPVIHNESPLRDKSKAFRQRERSGLIFIFVNSPLIFLPHIVLAAIKGFRAMGGEGHALDSLMGIWQAFTFCLFHPGVRRPVSIQTYRRFMELRRKTSIKLD